MDNDPGSVLGAELSCFEAACACVSFDQSTGNTANLPRPTARQFHDGGRWSG